MKYLFTNDTHAPVDKQILMVLDEMNSAGVNSEVYPTMMTYLERLNEIKVKERQDRVSRDTIALIAGNLMGILLLVAYEQKHVITSPRAFGQIIRPKST